MGNSAKNGKIVCDDGTYPIESVEVSYGYDMRDVSGVLRMTELKIESDAPSKINDEIGLRYYDELCGEEFNEEDECWTENAIKSIKDRLGVDDDIINIEIQ